MSQAGVVVTICIGCSLLAVAVPTLGQTREKGPWWPHPIWGHGDQAGASNWITPEHVFQAVKPVRTGQTYELGQVYERGMPLYGDLTFSLMIPGGPTDNEPFGKNMLVGNDEFVCAEIGQVGTQVDGLTHIGIRMTMADGSVQDVYCNGFTGDEILGAHGMRSSASRRSGPSSYAGS